jgi:hypothetical protein
MMLEEGNEMNSGVERRNAERASAEMGCRRELFWVPCKGR